MLNLIVVLTAITQGLVGLFVFQKRRNSITNIAFTFLSFASVAWAITNYIYTLDPTSSSSLLITRLVLFWVVIQNTGFYLFARSFPGSRLILGKKRAALLVSLSILAACATVSPYVFKSVTISGGQANPNPGPLIPIFMLHAIYTIGGGLSALIRKTKHAEAEQKRQLHYIIFASTLNWLVVPITNFVITLVFKTSFFARVSPFYTLLFASIIAYAIVAQKLFDIRAAVARSVGYVLLVATVAGIYAVGLFGVIDIVFAHYSEFTKQILSLFLVVPLALGFQQTKEYINNVTKRLFYRDAYDTQTVLNKLGRVAARQIELYNVLEEARRILEDALKCSFIEFMLIKEGRASFEARSHKVLSPNILELHEVLPHQKRELLITDELPIDEPMRERLNSADVALSLRLRTQRQTVGYIIFGQKRSGDIYSNQDKQLLVILANELAIAVQNALRFEEIQNFNLTLQAKVDEATRKLRRANEKLKALDETKDDFISMASHQLRTPLTSVKGYLSMVIEGDTGRISGIQKKMLGQAFLSSQRMVYLIADLLNVSRLKTGKFIIEAAPTNLATVIEEELAQLTETAASRNLTLTYEKPKDFPSLMLDETKTRQVIMNFADNAIYYTPSGGHIEVKLTETPTTVEFRVIDDGIGVPRSEQPHLFNKFYRAGNARQARPDGTGLGLFMAKKVIVGQGGALIFDSQEGKGSTFGFIFSKSHLAVKTDENPAEQPAKSPAASAKAKKKAAPKKAK